MTEETRIAQVSCGTEYSGVQGKLNEVAARSGIKLIFPEVELDDVAHAVSEFGYRAKSPGLNLLIARARSIVKNPEGVDGVFLLTCFKCAEGSIVKNEVRKYLQKNTDLPVVTYSTVDKVKEGGLMIRFEALKTLVTRKTLLMRTRQEGTTMGIDSGSSTTKCVIMKENEIVGTGWVPTTEILQSARKAIDLALESAGMSEKDIDATAVTGYGRHIIGDAIKADLVQEELTVNSKGAAFLADRQRGEATVLDIGGMDNKALTLNNAIPDDFTMGGVCAGASGRFLEITARRLGVDISELGELALKGNAESIQMDSYCSIFGIQSLVSALGGGASKEDVAAAACYSVAEQVHEQQLQEIDLREPIIEVGGTALIEGLKVAFEKILGFDIIVPPYPQFAGAVGGALIVSAFV